MPISVAFVRKLESVPQELKEVFLALMEEFERTRQETVTREEFRGLRDIVQQLAEAQKRTEEEIRKLGVSLRRTREQVGGLSRSIAYTLENEAYRMLPPFLKARHCIEVQDRMIRTEIRGEEVNLFARAKKNDHEVVLLGEAVLRLDDLGKLRKVKKKVKLASEEFSQEVFPVIVTHFAKTKVFEKAGEAGFLVVRSFEW